MKEVIVQEKYYVPESVKELKEKFDYDKYIEDNYREYPGYDWDDYLVETFEELLTKVFNITSVETYYSVSYHQGDGASFTGELEVPIDYDKSLKMLKEIYPNDNELVIILDNLYDKTRECEDEVIEISRCQNTHYYHSNTMCVRNDNIKDSVLDDVLFVLRELADWFYDKMVLEFESLTSIDNICEVIVDNGDEIPERYLIKEDA